MWMRGLINLFSPASLMSPVGLMVPTQRLRNLIKSKTKFWSHDDWCVRSNGVVLSPRATKEMARG